MTAAVLGPMLLVLFAGALIALQAPTNVMLARAGGSPVLAALISFAVGTAALLAVWLAGAARSGATPGGGAFAALPWYAWLGGLYGAVYVAAAAFAAPRIGLASLITIGVAGQVIMALWLDHIGALGLPQNAITPARVAGAVLVVAGVMLVRRG
jgi:transporter family-2 protein